jgi:hypothetical protein
MLGEYTAAILDTVDEQAKVINIIVGLDNSSSSHYRFTGSGREDAWEQRKDVHYLL